jgi:hypothetical protein
MSDQFPDDILSRWLARRIRAGRRWQDLYRAASNGNEKDGAILEDLCLGWSQRRLNSTWRRSCKRHELLVDVLGGGEDQPGVPSKLAQAATKRGMNPQTSSRHTKALGKELRECLGELTRAFVSLDRPKDRGAWREFHQDTKSSLLSEIAITSLPPTARRIAHIESMAQARGLRFVRSVDEDDDGFYLIAIDDPTTGRFFKMPPEKDGIDRLLTEIGCSLVQWPKPSARQRRAGARVGPKVTLEEHKRSLKRLKSILEAMP